MNKVRTTRSEENNEPRNAPLGLQDIVAPNLRVVFCGINPGLRAASLGHHFSGRGNRFWRTIHRAGFTPKEISPEDDASLLALGYGLTTAVERPTSMVLAKRVSLVRNE